jgi:2-keto-4-pentenoate hydratase/2-oxohepta-3-ene-1,7-dioic acid hydratase in catechol pathway
MKLLSFSRKGKSSYGAVIGDGIVDLGARLGQLYPTLRDALAADAIAELRRTAESGKPDLALTDIAYLSPIPNPEKILCIGVNYANRNAEYRDNTDLPKFPSLFMRTPGSLVGHGAPLLRPPESPQFDYEGEIAIVIGKAGRRIAKDKALSHIAGLTCLNEGTVRDWLRHGKFNVTQGKNFDASGAVGPWMTTADAFKSFDNLRVTTKVNGETRQDDTTASLIFPFDYLLNYVSTFTTLKPGDIIATGTPTGAGARFDPPKYLKAGDRVEVTVEGVGTLANTVADEAA